jgi:hypothetical protein
MITEGTSGACNLNEKLSSRVVSWKSSKERLPDAGGNVKGLEPKASNNIIMLQ